MNYALMLLARTFSIYDEIASRNYINKRMVSLKDKKYDTLKEVKTTENIRNLRVFKGRVTFKMKILLYVHCKKMLMNSKILSH